MIDSSINCKECIATHVLAVRLGMVRFLGERFVCADHAADPVARVTVSLADYVAGGAS